MAKDIHENSVDCNEESIMNIEVTIAHYEKVDVHSEERKHEKDPTSEVHAPDPDVGS